MIDCKFCGRHIPYDANVCPYCGRSIRDSKDAAPSDMDSPTSGTPRYVNTVSSQPERSNLWLYIIIIILLLLLLSFVGYFFLHRTPSDNTIANPSDTTVVQEPIDADAPAGQSNEKEAVNKKKEIIVNGEGVRMRFSPSLKSGYLKTSNGGTLSVKKGTRLPCVGEEGDWYKVSYQGKQYYMSKQFCILAK